MNAPGPMAALKGFAESCLAAERFPDDHHVFHPASCARCGVVPLRLVIEHHTGSKRGNFRGVVQGECQQCDQETVVLSFTGSHRQPLRRERPTCACGNDTFLVASCERIERDSGGFVDEGVLVGRCSRCGRLHDLVYTD